MSTSHHSDKPAADVLFSEEFQIERKKFRVDKKANGSGDFVQITESGRENIKVPASGIDDLIAVLQRAKGAK